MEVSLCVFCRTSFSFKSFYMIKSLFLGGLLFFCASSLQAQSVVLTVNDDPVPDNGLYDFFPREMIVDLVKREKHYELSKGKITLARGKNVVMTAPIDTGYIMQQFMPFLAKVKPGDKIIIDISEITESIAHTDTLHYRKEVADTLGIGGVQVTDSAYYIQKITKHKIKVEKYVFFTLTMGAKMKVDPNCTILINNSQNYLSSGAIGNEVESFNLKLNPVLKSEPVVVSVLRGSKTSNLVFKNSADLLAKYKTIFKFSLPNDVILFEFKKEGEKSCRIPVPIR